MRRPDGVRFAGPTDRGDGRPACRPPQPTGGPPVATALLLLLALGPGGSAGAVKPDPPATLAEVKRRLPAGSLPEVVRAHLGNPRRVARQVLSHRHLEQWLYDQPCPLRVTFDCPRGRKPRVVDVRPLSEPDR